MRKNKNNFIYINSINKDTDGFTIIDCDINKIKSVSYLRDDPSEIRIKFNINYISGMTTEISRSYYNKDNAYKDKLYNKMKELHNMIKKKMKAQSNLIVDL